MNRPVQTFDPKQEYAVVTRRLPHWSQAGTVAFITWRTWDSIPKSVLNLWLDERNAWLTRHGMDPADPNYSGRLQSLDPAELREFELQLSDRWRDYLDECHGACVLRRPELARIVADSLMQFDGNRYELTDYVIMPNHVHVLVAFPSEHDMLPQCESWKHYTAVAINRALQRKGRFWQQDGFDHLVRSPEQFEFLRRYIADNPRKSRLPAGQFIHWSKA